VCVCVCVCNVSLVGKAALFSGISALPVCHSKYYLFFTSPFPVSDVLPLCFAAVAPARV
jgi:hypothetical protein